ncbi:MAG: hypothetical protein ABI539_12105 [Acidobacteriota bacterium]
MRILILLVAVSVLCIATTYIQGQSPASAAKIKTAAKPQPSHATPAYAEVLLRQTELSAELESLTDEYTDEHPRIKEIRASLGLLKKEVGRLEAVSPSDTPKLSIALGRLIVKKVEIETEIWKLLQTYQEQHPDVKKARRKAKIYEDAIKDVLGESVTR